MCTKAIHECTRELTRTRTCEYFNCQIGTRTRANSFPRVTRSHESSTHELQVHPPSCKYLRVPAGTHRYSQVLAGSQRRKRAQRYVSSFLIYIFYLFIYITTKPTKAHSSQRRPTQVNAGPQRPTKASARPTTANAGQRRPSRRDSLVVSSASTCPPPPPVVAQNMFVFILFLLSF